MYRLFSFVAIVSFALAACVPAKKYNDLLKKEQACAEELEKYKTSSNQYESVAKDMQTKYDVASKELAKIKQDTSVLGNKWRVLNRYYFKLQSEYESLEKSFDKLKNLSAKETAVLQADLEAKNKELQSKEDALIKLDNELKNKQKLLEERERRVNELEEAMRKKDQAVELLKAKVANALRGF